MRRFWPWITVCMLLVACDGSDSTSTTATVAATVGVQTTTSTTTEVAPTTTIRPAGLVVPCPIETPSPPFDRSFYKKQCSAFGIPILSSERVADGAHDAAATTIAGMLSRRLGLVSEMLDHGLRVAIIAADEVTTDLPEYADLYELFPGTDWDVRTRGLGATMLIPVSSAAEENLLCLADDVYLGESIFVHEFAHSVRTLGLAPADEEMDQRIEQAYDNAMAAGRWADTYAATNSDEYWAETVQSYFDANASASTPDGIHNDVDTRQELAAYDPEVYALIDEVFASPDWRYACP